MTRVEVLNLSIALVWFFYPNKNKKHSNFWFQLRARLKYDKWKHEEEKAFCMPNKLNIRSSAGRAEKMERNGVEEG